jgi:cytochrome o ubiquinol oxidase subunit 2
MKKYFFVAIGAVTILVGLFSLFFTAPLALLLPEGAIALAERNLLYISLGLILIVVVPVLIMIPIFAWRYRASNTKATYKPEWDSNPYLEATWWGIPCVIIFILAVITWKSTHELDPYRPIESSVPPLEIQVVALNWKWLFIYPNEGIATINYVRFPEDTPLNFKITADAPMNSFWIPQLGGQIYAMPGMSTKLHLIADGVGTYRGASSNYSGEGFSGMRFVAESTSQVDFDRWVEEVKQTGDPMTWGTYTEVAKHSQNEPVALYRLDDSDLYNSIIAKYMAPMTAGEGHAH